MAKQRWKILVRRTSTSTEEGYLRIEAATAEEARSRAFDLAQQGHPLEDLEDLQNLASEYSEVECWLPQEVALRELELEMADEDEEDD